MIKYIVAKWYDMSFIKNEAMRVEVKYTFNSCPFKIWCSYKKSINEFQIKTYVNDHRCARIHKNSQMTAKWICMEISRKA